MGRTFDQQMSNDETADDDERADRLTAKVHTHTSRHHPHPQRLLHEMRSNNDPRQPRAQAVDRDVPRHRPDHIPAVIGSGHFGPRTAVVGACPIDGYRGIRNRLILEVALDGLRFRLRQSVERVFYRTMSGVTTREPLASSRYIRSNIPARFVQATVVLRHRAAARSRKHVSRSGRTVARDRPT